MQELARLGSTFCAANAGRHQFHNPSGDGAS
jgi:hypothetical protein